MSKNTNKKYIKHKRRMRVGQIIVIIAAIGALAFIVLSADGTINYKVILEKLIGDKNNNNSDHDMPDALKSISGSLFAADYNDSPYIILNNNKPYFTDDEYNNTPFEYYGDRDLLGRCTYSFACISPEMLPVEPRGSIGMIKPTGFHNKKYDFIQRKYLYNRCHLIAYQLTGENANPSNLVTGTYYLNVTGMEPFENKTADFIESNSVNVLYRSTPIFHGNNLVCDGIILEAASVPDKGESLSFCVFLYNVEPGVIIDYATGDNHEDKS